MLFNNASVFAYLIGLIAVLIMWRIFIKPIKWLFKLFFNSILGGLILASVNLIGGFAGISITIGPLSALLAGVLGLPGVLLVILLEYML